MKRPADSPVEVPAEPPASRYPRSVIDRPFSYPKGVVAVGFDLTTFTANSRFFDPATVRIVAGYGITDELEIAFGRYAFAINDAGEGAVDANIGYKLVGGAIGGKMDVFARVQTGYSIARDGMIPLQVGLQVGYLITPRFALFTPGQQLSFALSGDVKPITFSIPLSAGIQATETVWIQLDSIVADLNISKSANAFIVADTTPVSLSSYINVVPAIDVILGINANLTPPVVTDGATTRSPDFVDTIELMIGARYYIGKL